ncbi:MAG TPA: hypothetical protein VEA41_18585 [Salinarimonas sp.]|jgi:hypothetical protein|nr:hypothetical protein [Salinarimonas sp.]
MLTAPRQFLVLGLLVALLVAAAAMLSGDHGTRAPAGISAPMLPRAEPVATITPRQFDQRWSGEASITLASR